MQKTKNKALKEVIKAGELLERYNWHTISNLPESIYEDIEPFIKKDAEFKVAKIIRKHFNFLNRR